LSGATFQLKSYSGLVSSGLARESQDKIRDVLSESKETRLTLGRLMTDAYPCWRDALSGDQVGGNASSNAAKGTPATLQQQSLCLPVFLSER
jgi:hypothetical protein